MIEKDMGSNLDTRIANAKAKAFAIYNRLQTRTYGMRLLIFDEIDKFPHRTLMIDMSETEFGSEVTSIIFSMASVQAVFVDNFYFDREIYSEGSYRRESNGQLKQRGKVYEVPFNHSHMDVLGEILERADRTSSKLAIERSKRN
jgi:hypothetical protein